jgi:hypothetical protein
MEARHGHNEAFMNHISGSIKILGIKVSGLTGTTMQVHATVPRLTAMRSELMGARPTPKPAAPPPPVQVTQIPAKVTATPRPIEVKVIPPPKKRQPRIPKQEPAAPPVPVALKVIRRRREQAPKVFEKTVKSFPKGMLEGVDLQSEELEENQAEKSR